MNSAIMEWVKVFVALDEMTHILDKSIIIQLESLPHLQNFLLFNNSDDPKKWSLSNELPESDYLALITKCPMSSTYQEELVSIINPDYRQDINKVKSNVKILEQFHFFLKFKTTCRTMQGKGMLNVIYKSKYQNFLNHGGKEKSVTI